MCFSRGSIHLPISFPLWWRAVSSGQDVALVYTDQSQWGREEQEVNERVQTVRNESAGVRRGFRTKKGFQERRGDWGMAGCGRGGSELLWPYSMNELKTEKNQNQNLISHQTQSLSVSKVTIVVLWSPSYLDKPFTER